LLKQQALINGIHHFLLSQVIVIPMTSSLELTSATNGVLVVHAHLAAPAHP
jgi:hypothetical protein